jgi:hypothetical protein
LVMGSFCRQTSNGGSDKCDAIPDMTGLIV